MKKLILLIIFYPLALAAQVEGTMQIYELNSPQLEEIIADFINDEKTMPYYDDSSSFQLTTNDINDEYLCVLFANEFGSYRNDTLFLYGDIDVGRTVFIECWGHIIRIYFRNNVDLSFLKPSRKSFTIVPNYGRLQDDDVIIDDTKWPSYLIFSFSNEGVNILRKTTAIY